MDLIAIVAVVVSSFVSALLAQPTERSENREVPRQFVGEWMYETEAVLGTRQAAHEDHWQVVSREDPDGAELDLEPDAHPAIRPFVSALVEDGIPNTSFAVRDVAAEHKRLEALGVRFTQQPTDLGHGIYTEMGDQCVHRVLGEVQVGDLVQQLTRPPLVFAVDLRITCRVFDADPKSWVELVTELVSRHLVVTCFSVAQ